MVISSVGKSNARSFHNGAAVDEGGLHADGQGGGALALAAAGDVDRQAGCTKRQRNAFTGAAAGTCDYRHEAAGGWVVVFMARF